MKEVALLNTGVANIASVRAALLRLDVAVRFVEDASSVVDADALVFPGVGAFGAGMERLRQDGLARALQTRFAAGAPTLAICLGLQLLFEASEESPGVDGLGIVDGTIRRFPRDVRTPQFGWNSVEAAPESRYLTDGHAYFANSYACVEPPDGWAASTSTHGVPFVAAMEKGRLLACQFHPEISGPWGQEILRRWLFDEEA